MYLLNKAKGANGKWRGLQSREKSRDLAGAVDLSGCMLKCFILCFVPLIIMVF